MAEGPVSGRRIKRRTVHYAVIGIVVIVLIVVAIIGASSFYKKDTAQAKQNQLAEIKDVADTIASEVADLFSPTIEQLENLDPKQLIDIFAEDDKAVMETEADSLLENFPTGLKLRLFKPGNYELISAAEPKRSLRSLASRRAVKASM